MEKNKKSLFIWGIVIIACLGVVVAMCVATISIFTPDRVESQGVDVTDIYMLDLKQEPAEKTAKEELYKPSPVEQYHDGLDKVDLSYFGANGKQEKKQEEIFTMENEPVKKYPGTISDNSKETTASIATPKSVTNQNIERERRNITTELQPQVNEKKEGGIRKTEQLSNSNNNGLGETIVFNSNRQNGSGGHSTNGSLNKMAQACIHKTRLVKNGDLIQIRLLEDFNQYKKNDILSAQCNVSGNRVFLQFAESIKAYDLDDKEGLFVDNGTLKEGSQIIGNEIENTASSAAYAINSTIGNAAGIVSNLIRSANTNKSQEIVEIPSAYAVKLIAF